MTAYTKCVLVLIYVIGFSAGTQLLNCPTTQLKFEKLIGLRPNILQRNTLLYRSTNGSTAITLECLTKCGNDAKCTSFLLFYNSSECYSYSNESMTTQNYDYDSRPDTNVVWFRKTCLNVPDSCKTKAWVIEILAGATLVGANTKKIASRITRQRCIEYCMNERTFQCKSIKFDLVSKYQDITIADPLGFCTLSNTDRHLTPNAFRVSRYEDEYIENQCINTSYSKDYCAYEEYENTKLEHTDLILTEMTQQQCQEICDISSAFNCRGFSTVPSKTRVQNRNLQKFTCLLHSEDSKLIGPRLLISQNRATYYERARCLNVTVTCTSDLMTIIYQPEQPFNGRIYTNGFSDKKPCYIDGRFNSSIALNIPLNQSLCGLAEAHSAEPVNRTLKSVLLVIQYNAMIQTQADRLVKVGCVYGSNDDPEITLDTSVNFTNGYPSRGSTIVNSSSILPTVTMRIVDYNTKQAISDTEIGQELEMIIEITPGDGPYDIWASNLIATSGNNTLQLLDANGCPKYSNLFAPFTKIQTNTSIRLINNFQAFKFPSTSLVRFGVMVHFCTINCPPMQCFDDNLNRLKREIVSGDQIKNDTVNATVYKINEDIIDELPLDVLLIVRGANLTPDQLVLGENNMILVGYDYVTNKVCIDYSLFIGLIVIWVILQVILVACCFLLIRKYKKYFHVAYTRQLDDMHQNFGFGNRRVHWADQ